MRKKDDAGGAVSTHPGSAMAIGVAVGVALGIATDNLALWIGVGTAVGVAIGLGWSRAGHSDGDDDLPPPARCPGPGRG